MYKDVKMKLLAVVLSICMVIGAVEIVPKVKAAAADTPGTLVVSIYEDGNSSSKKSYTVKYDTSTFTYNGTPQGPTVVSVEAGAGEDLKNDFEFVGWTTDVGLGTFTCTLQAKRESSYHIDTQEKDRTVSCTMYPAVVDDLNPDNLIAVPKSDVIALSGSSAYAEFESVKVKAEAGKTGISRTFTLSTDDYEVTPFTEVSKTGAGKTDKSCTLTVTNSNFVAKDGTSNPKKVISGFKVAYDINKNDVYEFSIEGGSEQPYNGKEHPARVMIKPSLGVAEGEISYADDGTVFSVSKSSTPIQEVGDYTITVSVRADYDIVGDTYFTGTKKLSYKVSKKNEEGLLVYVDDPKDPSNRLCLTGPDKKYLILEYQGTGVPVVPTNIVVQEPGENGGKVYTADPIFRNSTRVGEATMEITLNDPRYEGTLKIPYFIASSFKVGLIKFDKYDDNKTELPYNDMTYLDALNLKILNLTETDLDKALKEGTHYTLEFNYPDEDGNYSAATKMNRDKAKNDENMKSAGEKMILVVGKGDYDGHETEIRYRITEVDYGQHPTWFSAALEATEFYYNGKEQKPGVTVKYKNLEVTGSTEIDLVEGRDYTLVYRNNENAGTATVDIVLQGNYKGTISKSFTIKPLELTDAVVSGASIYNGSPIYPNIVLKGTKYTYTLATRDYKVVDASGKEVTSPMPKDAGTYDIYITSNNANISGSKKKLTYTIEPKNINDEPFGLEGVNNGQVEWNGGATEPALINTRLLPDDYVLIYENHTDPMVTTAASLTIHGKNGYNGSTTGNYTGTKVLNYYLSPRVFADNKGFEFKTTAKEAGLPNYEVKLELKDTKRADGKLELKIDTDYEIVKVEQKDFEAENPDLEWKEILKGTATGQYEHTPKSDTLTLHTGAGRYRITVRGMGARYSGELTKEFSCGTDISQKYAAAIVIAPPANSCTFMYNGAKQFPEKFILVDKTKNNAEVEDITYDANPDDTDFTIAYERDDVGKRLNIDVGKIYVVAVGNPMKGYYGRTERGSSITSYYTITAPKWTDANFEAAAIPDKETFFPNGKTPLPDAFVVTCGGVALRGGSEEDPSFDFVIEYLNTVNYQTVNEKRVKIRGINNYAGNEKYVTYTVEPLPITHSAITVEQINKDNFAGKPEFKLTCEDYELQPKIDYDVVDAVPATKTEGGKLVYCCEIRGKGNFTGKIEKNIDISSVSFDHDIVIKPQEEAKTGEYYVLWDEDELIIDTSKPENSRPAVKPSKFTIFYKSASGSDIALISKADVAGTDHADAFDYYVDDNGYGTNNTPGNHEYNYLTVVGNEARGYTDNKTINFKLYSDISYADTTETSLIQKGAADPIPKSQWMNVLSGGAITDLIQLKPFYKGEKNQIDPSQYTLEWSAGFNPMNPMAGSYKLRVVGKQCEDRFYTKEAVFDFTIVNSIDNAEIVLIDDSEPGCIGYTGVPAVVTRPGVQFDVYVDGIRLELDKDFYIDGYNHNDQIGDATVTLKGKGEYTGTKIYNFKVTYPIDDLKVYVKDPADKVFKDITKTDIHVDYTGKEQTLQVKVFCPAGIDPDHDYKDDPAKLNAPTYYTVSYRDNTNTGTASLVINPVNGYFTGSIERALPFYIDRISIERATSGGAVSYSWKSGQSADTIRVPYTGKPYNTAESLELVLKNLKSGQTLVEGVDFRVEPFTDVTNVRKTLTLPQVFIYGIGNYKDTATISFEIEPLSIANVNGEIEGEDEITLIYSGDEIEEALKKKLIVRHRSAGYQLQYGEEKDYVIEGYYSFLSGGQNKIAVPSAVGDYCVKLQGLHNYSDLRTITVHVVKKDITEDPEGLKIYFENSPECPINSQTHQPICIYNGLEHRPLISVTYTVKGNEIRLEADKDYTVQYGNGTPESITNAGEATVTVTATADSNFTGSATATYTIQPKNIAIDADILSNTMKYSGMKEKYDFTGVSVDPGKDLIIYDDEVGRRLTSEGPKDYEISYVSEYAELEVRDGAPEHSYAGKVTMTVTGQNNYTGTQEFTFYIGEDISDITQLRVLIGGQPAANTTYNSLQQPPKNIAISGSTQLLENPDGTKRYDIAYFKDGFNYSDRINETEFVNAGTYYVAVVGVPSKGTYAKNTAVNSAVYTIAPRTIANSTVSGFEGMYYYNMGQEIRPTGIIVTDTNLPIDNTNSHETRSVELRNGVDYTVDYSNNTQAGKATIIITGIGNYNGNVYGYFTIDTSNVTGNNIYDGNSEGTGSISNGTTSIAASDIILYGLDGTGYMAYTGAPRTPTITINKNGLSVNDFIVTASNNTNPGVATLMITGRGGNFSGVIMKTYMIKADLSRYATIGAIPDQMYTGSMVTPNVVVNCANKILVPNVDYTLTYSNNINQGRAEVLATANSNSYYIGSVKGGFNIGNNATGMQVTGYASSYTYTGYPISPDVIVTMNGRTLVRGTDYTVTYSNNTNVGTATMVVTGLGSYSGTRTINYTIAAKNIENCITTSVNNYQYSGGTYTPSITVTDSSTGKTLVAGSDYTITYSNNTNPGNGSVTVTALGDNYTGSKVIPFKITSAAVSGLRTSTIKNNSIKLSWSAQDYADGYQICNSSNRVVATTSQNSYTVKGLTSCTTYKFKVRSYVENADGSVSYGDFSTAVSAKTMLNTPKLTAKSTKKGKVNLTWSKVSKASGYEIYYSTKKNGVYTKLKTITKPSTLKYVDSGLASGEKYYYTIRAYRVSNGVKTYSSYNTIKYVKVK